MLYRNRFDVYINIDFFSDYKNIITNLLVNNYNFILKDLPNDFNSVIILFSKVLRQRKVSNKKWKIVRHPDLVIPSDLKSGFESLINSLKIGKNIERYMTARINFTNHKDEMLDYDNVFHFHLSDNQYSKNKNFNCRTDERAFVYFNHKNITAYIIGLYKHGGEYKEIKDRLKKLNDMCNVFGKDENNIFNQQYTDTEIHSLRESNVNTLIGTSYKAVSHMVDNCMVTSGESLSDINYLSQTKEMLLKIEKKQKQLPLNLLIKDGVIDIRLYNVDFKVYLIARERNNIKKKRFLFNIN